MLQLTVNNKVGEHNGTCFMLMDVDLQDICSLPLTLWDLIETDMMNKNTALTSIMSI